MKRILSITIICVLLSNCAYAGTTPLMSKIRKIFYYKSTKSKPLQVKTMPANAVCSPDVGIPDNCNVKK